MKTITLKDTMKIEDEKNLIFRAIWNLGYNRIIFDYPENKIILINDKINYSKDISMTEYNSIKKSCIYEIGLKNTGISNKNKTYSRLKKLIDPECI